MTQRRYEPERDAALAREAKAVVALAFRNGPIEDVHAGKRCPTCADDQSYSGITDEEMKQTMKFAVNRMATLLYARDHDPARYAKLLAQGELYTKNWDEPDRDNPQ